MHGGHYGRTFRPRHHFSMILSYPERPADQSLRRSGTEANHHFGLDHLNLGFQPWETRPDLSRVWFGVDPALAAWFPLEVFHHVSHVCLAAVDASSLESLIQDSTRGSDEWLSCQIFIIARLLPDKHHRRVFPAL